MLELIQTADYTGPERRRYSKTLEQLEADIKQIIADHEIREKEWVNDMKAEVMTAFPDGPIPHREYHQKKIDAAKEEAEFWRAAKLKVVEIGVGGVFGVLKIVLGLAVLGFAYKVGLGPVIAKMLE